MWKAVYNYRGYEITFISDYGEEYLPRCARKNDAGFDLRLRLSDPQPFPEGLKPLGAYIDGVWTPGKGPGKSIEELSWQNYLLIPAGEKRLVNTGLRWMVLPRDPEPDGVVGLVDMQYPQEIKVGLWNTSEFDHYLSHQARIAQGVVATFASFSLGNETERTSGFGHTGV